MHNHPHRRIIREEFREKAVGFSKILEISVTIAMIRSAPMCLAESTPSNPTAPSPTTATVEPGFTLAASAANQPVPRGPRASVNSESSPPKEYQASRPRYHRERDTLEGGLCGAAELALLAGRLVSDMAVGTGIVGRKDEPMTNWPGLIDLTAGPTSSTMPQYSCPMGVGCPRPLPVRLSSSASKSFPAANRPSGDGARR